jgi:hypothetical protein
VLQKPKKTAGSIKKSKGGKDQQKTDLDELKQLLNLAPPTIDINMFERGMSMSGGEGAEKPKKKRLSKKQKGFQALLRGRHQNTQRDHSPKTLLDRQIAGIESQMKPEVLATISRGQKKRLEKKVSRFASKKALEERGQKVREELAQEAREKQREAEKNRAAQQ